LFCIFFNSITLAVYDYSDRDSNTQHNKALNKIGSAFAIIFAVEAFIKIIALGFIGHKYAYIRDPWNILDFIIASTG